jgi:5-formyltetrahydrofolate cyclo-ligase
MKKELRKIYRNLRKTNLNYDDIVCSNLYELVKKHSRIALYMSINHEVNVESLINKLLINQEVYLPYVNEALEFHKLHSLSEITLDKANIQTGTGEAIPIDNLDIIVMPCIACNFAGYRLGYGAGYYDKALQNYKGIKVGVTYENCLTEVRFDEEFDVRLNYIVTEQRIIKIV